MMKREGSVRTLEIIKECADTAGGCKTLTRKVPVLLDHFQSDKERSASLGTFWLKSTR